MCAAAWDGMCLLAMLQDRRSGQQNPNKTKDDQCQQGHYQYRHSYTSLLPKIVSPEGGPSCDPNHLLM
jgi:hypothetical protein